MKVNHLSAESRRGSDAREPARPRFYQRHPFAVGVLVALVGLPIAFTLLTFNPSWAPFISKNRVWFIFGVYTATVFPLLFKWYRPAKTSGLFWSLLLALGMTHTIGVGAIILFVRPLTPVDYIVFGPLECIVLGIVLDRILRLLKIHPREIE